MDNLNEPTLIGICKYLTNLDIYNLLICDRNISRYVNNNLLQKLLLDRLLVFLKEDEIKSKDLVKIFECSSYKETFLVAKNISSLKIYDPLGGISIKNIYTFERIDLEHLRLEEFPVGVCCLIYLEDLCLMGNHIKRVPKEIKNLIHLDVIILQDNEIEEFPVEILECTTLSELHINSNKLNSIPSEINKLVNLEWLNLADNNITDVIKEITDLENLDELTLSQNPINSLPDELTSMKLLETFDIDLENLDKKSKKIALKFKAKVENKV